MKINIRNTVYLIVVIAIALVLARMLAAALSWVWNLAVGVAAVVLIVWVVRLVVGKKR